MAIRMAPTAKLTDRQRGIMSAYGQGRDQEYLAKLRDGPINDFVSRYNANPNDDHRTIFLFPGGLASQLIRATSSYQDGPPFCYYTAWLDCSIVLGAANYLQMNGDEDYRQHYVLPDGCIDFISLRPYSGFIQWCQVNWIDLFVFGWDWRRGTEMTADFFLQQFLPLFETIVTERKCCPPPLDNFWLIGHSFGGMVVKKILNHSNNQYVKRMKGAITVATPFYGYGGQVHRFFKGDSLLNWTEEPNGAAAITEIVSTMPGVYELLFLDEPTYNANAAGLGNDPEGYNLACYPSMDAETAGQAADPYNPIPGQSTAGPNGRVRYISDFGFDWRLLSDGQNAFSDLVQPLNPTIVNKFWNIRCVRFKGKKVSNDTVVSQTWKLVQPTFDPDADCDPITDTHGPGDGTLPAWSTRLLGNSANVYTVKGDFEHMTLMNEAQVQVAIANLLAPPKQMLQRMRKTAKTTKMKAARRAQLNKLLKELQGVTAQQELTPALRAERIRQHLAQRSPDELQKLLARAYLDALKSPSQISSGQQGRDNKKKSKRPR